MPINHITQEDVDTFAEDASFANYQRIATKSAIYPGKGMHIGLMYATLKLNGEAGELAEHVGKAVRDDGYGQFMAGKEIDLTAERQRLLMKEAGDVLWYLSAICNELRRPLAEIAWLNLTKLKDRTDRNKLQGSGDER